MKRETKILLIAYILLGIVIALYWIGRFISLIQLRPDSLPADTPADGVGRDTAQTSDAGLWLSPVCAGEIETALPVYTEGEWPVPEWYRPDEPMSAVWVDNLLTANSQLSFSQVSDNFLTSDDEISVDDPVNAVDGEVNALQSDSVDYNAPEGIDPGGIDWNLCTTLWGWDGHGMELWEMELFSRIVYLEFWGCSPECCEAGADAILRLWESGYYGRTLFETVSAVTEGGSWVFSTYPAVWETEYDPDGLAEMRELCEERFHNGPEWCAEFFRTGYYHPWAVPCYELDGVYFSTFREGTR